MVPDTVALTWEGLSALELARRCAVPRIELLSETESTQDVAHALAEGGGGAPAGTTVLADTQRAGRGRLGRTWTSQPGLGVWCTVLERPVHTDALDLLSLRVGLNAAEALDRFAGERVGVKWPNDLILQRGKLGGILVEARWSGSSLGWVAIGVGVNVIAPPDVAGASALARGARRTDVLVEIVRAVRTAAAAQGRFTNDELARFRARDVLAGRRIVSPAAGTVAGITATGSLVVETVRGSEHVRAGTIRLAGEEGRDA